MTKDRTSLRLSAGHHHFDHRAPSFCARENGYFSDEGLGSISIEATGHDGLTLNGLRNGTIDIGLDVTPPEVFKVHEAGLPMLILGTFARGVNQILVARPEYNSIADLRGKRIQVVEQGTGVDWQPLRILLRKNGIDPDHDIELIYNAGFPTAENADRMFSDNVADARMILVSQRENISKMGYSVLYDFTADYPIHFPQRTVVTTKAFAEQNPAALSGFLRALVRGYRFVRSPDNYQSVMETVEKYVTDPNLGFPPGFPRSKIKDFSTIPVDGETVVSSLQRSADEEIFEGNLIAGFDVRTASNLDLMADAAQEIDTRFGAGRY